MASVTMRKSQKNRVYCLLIVLFVLVIIYMLRNLQSEVQLDMDEEILKADLKKSGSLKTHGQEFTLDGEALHILGGSVHYFRVPREYWRDRLLKLKACGLNTLTTYVAWNLHEPQRGVFDFSGSLDIGAFIQLAKELDLHVILRPGPYICAEWDLGGLPSWLLADPDMKLRTTYSGFLDAVDNFFEKLMPNVAPLQYTYGGPIIAVQVENEYGAYAKDTGYMESIKQVLQKHGIIEFLMTSDNKDGLSQGALDGALSTMNFKHFQRSYFEHLDSVQPNLPKMVMEFWTGWFDSWGNYHMVFNADALIDNMKKILDQKASINLYMFHGGTNFGFMNGAVELPSYQPDITSYDYDAPLSEAGDYTPKYKKIRQLLMTQFKLKLIDPPPPTHKAAYGIVAMNEYLPLWSSLEFVGKPIHSALSMNMEKFPINDGNGQSYGYALYETKIRHGGLLKSNLNVHDRAQIFLNSKSQGFFDYVRVSADIPDVKEKSTLSFLVENRGRVNYGLNIDTQRKGLTGNLTLDEKPLEEFQIYPMEMKQDFINSLEKAKWSTVPLQPWLPAFFRGTLQISGTPQDTFVRLDEFEKGVVFVNGKNLGRYWILGPQKTLYLPAPWLKEGDNKIVLFEESKGGSAISFVNEPELGKPVET